jgi:membrane protein YdbS with pleckstrin-like domain
MRNFILHNWNLVMDYEKNPLSNIPSLVTRHMIMQVLAWMWVIAFTIATGTWAFAGMNVIVHTVLIAAIVVTVATFETAKRKPNSFNSYSGRAGNGEHE